MIGVFAAAITLCAAQGDMESIAQAELKGGMPEAVKVYNPLAKSHKCGEGYLIFAVENQVSVFSTPAKTLYVYKIHAIEAGGKATNFDAYVISGISLEGKHND